ncbi:unnamed protein product [Effrenium voratum]|nr:unnamed protein product [Effrenium voratum]
MQRRYVGAFAALAAALWGGLLFPSPPPCPDEEVSRLSADFQQALPQELTISCRGQLLRDRDTFFWSLFTDHFGSNPNTPYMWMALPAFGFLLPSPMWHVQPQDAVVLLARRPPEVEYFSFTSFALWVPRRGLQFSSLGDSVNNLNLKETQDHIFAHVLTASNRTFTLVEEALVKSGLPKSAINLAVIPSDVGGLFQDWTHFETVLRLFRFRDQAKGDAYLQSHYPVVYLKGSHGDSTMLPTRPYKDRAHVSNGHERMLEQDFMKHNSQMLANVGSDFGRDFGDAKPLRFTPLMIQGLECLRHNTECLGDCPDAAYYGPNVHEDSDGVDMLKLSSDDELHVVSLVNHRHLNISVYGNLAVLRSWKPTLSKTRMSIRATSLGVTSFEFPEERFISWAFTRNPAHCHHLRDSVHGCSLLDAHVSRESFLTYCERIYLNPVTGTGPNWSDLLPAHLFHLRPASAPRVASPTARVASVPPLPLRVFDGTQALQFSHVVKTGGESLELYLGALSEPGAPRLDYGPCRRAAAAHAPGNLAEAARKASGCEAAAGVVSFALCGLNCECCASDLSGAFRGVLLRSPRAHALSVFTHCHGAHHNSWGRILEDVPQYLAEGILRATEMSCGSYCTSFAEDWEANLGEQLLAERQDVSPVRVIPWARNMQSHALTCSVANGSLGQHFRTLSERVDVEEALESLQQFHWVGLTDLMEQSVCLLHFQHNGTLPAACDCRSEADALRIPRFAHGVQQRDPETLPEDLLRQLDEFTAVDARLFAKALRLLLGRLRSVELQTGAQLLPCLPWRRLWRSTRYVPGLWAAPEVLAE